MKYFLKVLIVLVLACAVVTGVYYFTHGNRMPFANETLPATTVSKPAATEKNIYKTLLASLDDEGFALYKSERKVILEHKGKSFEFDNWSSVIAEEPPQMYYFNVDSDKDKELIIRAVSGIEQSSGAFIYDLYILDPVGKGENEDYSVVLISQDTWRSVLERQIIQEVSQLKYCKKAGQLAMAIAGDPITYDKTTGIAKKCGYQGYFRVLQDDKGNYLTINSYSKGKGVYTIEKNKILINIDVNIAYNEISSLQTAGTIIFEIQIEDGKMKIGEKSMVFRAAPQYKLADPRKMAKAPWEYTEQNSSSAEGKEINWIKYTPAFDSSTLTQKTSFAGETTDIKNVSSVKITQESVILTASEGSTFDPAPAKNGEFSININSGKDDAYEISYTAQVDESGRVLTIYFDKSYPRDFIKTIDISYGSK